MQQAAIQTVFAKPVFFVQGFDDQSGLGFNGFFRINGLTAGIKDKCEHMGIGDPASLARAQ